MLEGLIPAADPLVCPNCYGNEWKSASLVHAEGLSISNYRTRGSAGGIARGGGHFTVGGGVYGGQTAGVNQTAISFMAAPPRRGILSEFLELLGFKDENYAKKKLAYDCTRVCQRCGTFYLGGSSFLGEEEVQGPPKTAQYFMRILVGVLVVLLFALAILSNKNQTTTAPVSQNQQVQPNFPLQFRPVTQPEEIPIQISAADLLAQYQADEQAANNLFKGKLVKVSGILTGVFVPPLDVQSRVAQTGGNATAFVTLGGPLPSSISDTVFLPGIKAYSKETAQPSLLGFTDMESAGRVLQIGTTVTVACRLRDAMKVSDMVLRRMPNDPDFSISLEDCVAEQEVPVASRSMQKQQVVIGQTEEQVVAILGPPSSVTIGAKRMFHYSGVTLTFKNGILSEIQNY